MSTKPASSTSSPEAESIISRTILGPVLFVSFIVSLFVVDKQTAAGILESNTRKDSKHGHEHYYHSYQRKLAKREFDDAFALRKRVIAAMCVAGVVGLTGLGWFLTKAWAFWCYYQSD
jgi:hypothetical protein